MQSPEGRAEVVGAIMKMVASPEFKAAHKRGLEQIARGQTVTLEELEAKFGEPKQISSSPKNQDILTFKIP